MGFGPWPVERKRGSDVETSFPSERAAFVARGHVICFSFLFFVFFPFFFLGGGLRGMMCMCGSKSTTTGPRIWPTDHEFAHIVVLSRQFGEDEQGAGGCMRKEGAQCTPFPPVL